MSDDSDLRSLASELAKASGKLLIEASATRRSRAELIGAARKKSSATDLATAADRASERLIVDRLRAVRPDDAIMGEEGSENSGTSGLTWIIDPIDGTTNFVYAFPAWTVSIGVADDEGTVAGAVYDATRGELFTAARGKGAFLNGRPLGPLAPPRLEESLIGTGFSYSSDLRRHQASLLLTLLPRVRDIRRAGAASLDLCYVGAGRLDGFYEAALRPWDRAAGLLVAAEAGAQYADLKRIVPGSETLVVAAPSLLSPLRKLLIEAATGR